MKALFGTLKRANGSPLDSSLTSMRAPLVARDAVDLDTWADDWVALGQTSGPADAADKAGTATLQRDVESGLVIVADARLDDRAALVAKLGLTSSAGLQSPDARLILLAYLRWGRACLDQLLGDFAFVIYSPRDRLLFCARSPLGAKPFYYHLGERVFIFASTARAVAAHATLSAPVDPARVADLLVGFLERIDETCTFFQGVSRLPPAHWLEVTPDATRSGSFWCLDPTRELRLGTDREYVDALDKILRTAVADRLPTAGPPGAMLSGGIDSSTIVGMARKLQGERAGPQVKTFSGVSDQGPAEPYCRETYFADSVIASGGLDAVRLSPSAVSALAERLIQAERAVEDPFDAGGVMHRLIYLRAREAGCRMIFDGVDGDVVASLNSAYPAYLLRSGQVVSAMHELRQQYKNYFRRQLTFSAVLQTFRSALLPVPSSVRRMRARSRVAASARQQLTDSFLAPELAREIDLEARIARYQEQSGIGFKPSLRYEHISRVVTADLTAGVERYARMANSMGLENRQPFLDRRVVEFCVSLPWNQLCRDGWSKFALRKVAERYLPAEVAWRPGWEEIAGKFTRVLKAHSLQQDAERVLAQGDWLQEWVDWPRVRAHFESRLQGRAEYSQAEHRVVALVNWHERLANGR